MAKRKAVSIKDIAKASGSSLTTVSLVLNSRDRRISAPTRQRVLEAVERLGYRPSRLAQALQSQRAGLLAILVPELRHAFADVYFGELISAIHDEATDAGYKVLLEVAHPKFIDAGQHLEIFDRRFIDGMLCLGVTSVHGYLSSFEDGVRPMVVVNNYVEGLDLNHVRCDYRAAGRIAAEHLIAAGHRRVGMVRAALEVQTMVDLIGGYKDALAKAGVKLADADIVDGLYTEEGGAAAASELIRRRPDLTALLAGNDKMAIGAIAGLKAAGKRVPDDVSVIGCDDIHQGEFCDPPLTTVHTPIYDMGRAACKRLLEIISGNTTQVREVHPVRLTVRKSVAKRSS